MGGRADNIMSSLMNFVFFVLNYFLCCNHDDVFSPSQCAKLLADISVIHFYPSKFVLITDILDNFGNISLSGCGLCITAPPLH